MFQPLPRTVYTWATLLPLGAGLTTKNMIASMGFRDAGLQPILLE